MSPRSDVLFYGPELRANLDGNLKRAADAVDDIPKDQFMHTSDDEIIDHVFSRMEIFPIELHEDRMEVDPQEIKTDVSQDSRRYIRNRNQPFYIHGAQIIVSIPFTGDANLWHARPNSRISSGPPSGSIRNAKDELGCGYLDVVLEVPIDAIDEGKRLKNEVDRNISDIKWYLNQVNGQVRGHNQQLRSAIQKAVTNRRQRLGKLDTIAELLEIPLKRRNDAPAINSLPVKQKLIKPLRSKPQQKNEYGIADETYSHILQVIRHEGRSFETTPRTFQKHDEEEIRDIIVAHLNGHYEGRATGETFRKQGKTDIRIEEENRAAFVAECKLWRGPKEAKAAVDQLLSYLTWRDCKAALVIFNKTVARFSGIQSKLPDVLREHPNFDSAQKIEEPGEWRMVFRSADDEERRIVVHVFLFDLYIRKKKDGGGNK